MTEIGDRGMTASDGTMPEKSVKIVLQRLKKEFKCDHCDYKSLTARDLRLHVRGVHILREGKSVHKTMENQYSASEDLPKKYAKIVLKKLQDLKCDLCDYRTVIKKGFRKHMRASHNIIIDFACEECKYTTRNNSNLWNHIRAVS